MSAAPSMAIDKEPRRVFPRQPINVPLDLIALRSGVPENLPGRCTDISEAGVGAGEVAIGQQVAVELRLPNVGLPVRARALVRYQSHLRCGLEFVGLSVEQREMIRYWIYRSTAEPIDFNILKKEVLQKKEHQEHANNSNDEALATEPEPAAKPKRRIRIVRRGLYMLIASILALAALGW